MTTVRKDGYRSEKRDSFATAVNILTFIFGLGVVVMALCLYALTQGCEGGGSDSGTDGGCVESCSSCPACGYIENGICMLNNCTYNGDSWVGIDNGSLPGDSVPTYADGKPIPPMNTTPYVCPNPDKPPKVCMPKVAEDARCIFYDYKTDSNPDCDLSQTDHCWCSGGFYDQTDCSSQSLCQKVPPEAYPPCVCWEFCGYAGEWRCSDTVSINVTIAESTDGSYCAIDINEGAFKLIGKPNEPPPRYPLDNPVSSLTLTENGVNYSEDNSYTWHCTAVTE